jgi:hypothetical protein
MDARFPSSGLVPWLGLLLSVSLVSFSQAQPGARVRSENFVVTSRTPEFAKQVAEAAETMRRELSIYWLGEDLPKWPQPCPIHVMAAPNLGAGGQTTFTLIDGTVRNWRMSVQGTPERVLDSVLPHEITHTILATHFASLGKPVPRWADEGACTTVEHRAERSKHEHMLVEFLQSGRGIPFAAMFTMRDYPQDIMPLYAQGYSVAAFLIAQGGEIEGPRRFVKFLEDGMRTEDWVSATEQHYGYPRVGKLQSAWNQWVGEGGGQIDRFTAVALGHSTRDLASLARNDASNNSNVRLASASQSLSDSSDNAAGATWRAALGSPQANPQTTNQNSLNPVATTPTSTTIGPLDLGNTPTGGQPGFNSPFPSSPNQETPGVQHSVTQPQPTQTIGGDYINWSAGSPGTTKR